MKKSKRKKSTNLIGVCRTFFFNPADRKKKLLEDRRPCYVAYVGHGRTFKSKRFPIDTLGRAEAMEMAAQWRWDHGASVYIRACDATRQRKAKLRAKK